MQPEMMPLAPAMGLTELFAIDAITSADSRRKASANAYSRGLPMVKYRDVRNGQLAICASGPSAKDYVEKLRNWTQEGEVWAINGAFNWLRSEGVKVSAFVGMDPEEILVDYLKDIPEDATYYISNQCHPAVFDRLKDRNVKIWHIEDPAVTPAVGAYPIPGGSTCLGRAPYLACLLGWKSVHLFGGDSSYDTDGYAYGGEIIANEECLSEVNGVVYKTNRQMLAQAVELVEMVKNFPGEIMVHGRGLFPTMAEEHYKSFKQIMRVAKKLEKAA